MKEKHKILLLGELNRSFESLYENLKVYFGVEKSEIGTAENELSIKSGRPELIVIFAEEFVKWKMFPIKNCTPYISENNIPVLAIAKEQGVEAIRLYLSDVRVESVVLPSSFKQIILKLETLLEGEAPKRNEIVKKHIVVIEDDKEAIAVIDSALGIKYDVFYAPTLGDCFIQVGQKKVDAILMDYSLSDCSGADAIRMLRNTKATREIPVICIEDPNNNYKLQECMDLRPKGCLLKPLRKQLVSDAIDNAFV